MLQTVTSRNLDVKELTGYIRRTLQKIIKDDTEPAMNTSQFDALARRQKVIWTQQPWSCICSNLTAGDAILL